MVREYGIVSPYTGDKYNVEHSLSATSPKLPTEGLINLNITHSTDREFDSINLESTLTGTSTGISTSGTGVISLGQAFGETEVHYGRGFGFGAGETNYGFSNTLTGEGYDLNIRPGLGTAALIIGVATSEVWLPLLINAAPAYGAASVIIGNSTLSK